MSVYHSTTSGQQSSSPAASGAINGQSATNPSGKTDLTLDYLASVFASNGSMLPSALPQHSGASALAPSTGDIMNALITAAAAAAAAATTATNSPVSSASVDPFTASTLFFCEARDLQASRELMSSQNSASFMYSQQQQQHPSSLVPPSPRHPPTDLYPPKSNLPLDPVLFAQQVLMQAGADAPTRQNQHSQQAQQQQMALAMANLLGQCGSDPLLSLQRHDLYSYRVDGVDEIGAGTTSTAGSDESFSSVLAKLTQGLNQGSSTATSLSASSRAPTTSQVNPKESLASSTSSSGVLANVSRFPLQGSGENAAAFAAAAALTALQQQQQQNRLGTSKPSSHISHRSTPLGTTLSREGQPHRGRGRPPKASFTLTKTPLDRSSRSTMSAPQPESTMTDSNSIDGTITDVLKRFNDSVDQSGSRKRRRTESNEKAILSAAAATGSTSSTFTSGVSPSSSKSDALGHKRARTFADSGYRLPLGLGWRRETLVKGVGPGGLLGDVVYIAPCGRQFWNIEGIREYLRSTGNSILTTEDFTFKSYVRLGHYYECNKDSKGFVKMSEAAVNALITTGQESPSGSQGRTSQEIYSSTSPASTTTVTTNSTSTATTSAKCSSGVSFSPDLMGPLTTSNAESYSKSFTTFPLDLPRFPSLSPQLTAALANQIGSLWSPWLTGIHSTAMSPLSTSSSFALPTAQQQQQQQQQKDHFPFLSSNLNNLEDFDRLRAFFTKLVEDHQRLETEKETQRRADLEAQTTKAREEHIAYLVDEELRRPVEDLKLINPKPLPVLERIDGNRMPSHVFTDCIFVLEFLHAFTEVLCIDPETIPSMRCMQAAFIDGDKTCINVINHLIIELLKFAILDPGIPTPRLVTQLLSQRFSEMEVNTHTVTGLLRVFLIGRNGYEDEMSDWLAPSNVNHLVDLPGPQLASLLAFICDELACSSRIISNEVDRTIELQISLRRDQFNLEAKIRKIRVILARKFGLDHMIKSKESDLDGNKRQPAFLQSTRQQSSLQRYDSGDEDELNSSEELEKRIEVLQHSLEAKQRAIEECSFRLSGVFLGQDRFHRNYFILGSVGGIYVEGQPLEVRKGSSIQETPRVFDSDAIVAEIRARKELSVMRHFSTNASSTSNSAVLTQKPSLLRPISISYPLATFKNDMPTAENGREEIKSVELEIKIEDEVQNVREETECFSDQLQKETLETQGDGTKFGADLDSPNIKQKISGGEEDLEESATWQPLDLSTKRASPPSPHTQLTSQESDLTVWQSLTEQDLTSALDACQLDDTFLTTATLLFATQTDAIDRSAIVGGWTDPNWHIQLLFYKLQLVRSIAFERRRNCANDPKTLSVALKQLKTWLAEGIMEKSEERHRSTKSSTDDMHLDEREMAMEVERILKDRGIQEAGPEVMDLIPVEKKGDWWRVIGSEGLQALLKTLLPRGIRERGLGQAIQLAEEAVTMSIHVDPSAVLDFAPTANGSEDCWKPRLLRVRSRRGKGRGANASTPLCPSTSATSPSLLGSGRQFTSTSHSSTGTSFLDFGVGDADTYAFRGDVDAFSGTTMERSVFLGENFERAMRTGRSSANSNATATAADNEFLDEYRFLELVEGLVDRVLSASLQTKGWQAPMKATEDDSIQIVPRNTPKVYRCDYWPLELARERLLDLEAHTERRYLLPPLNCESRLDIAQAAGVLVAEELAATAEGSGSVCSDSTTHEETSITSQPHLPSSQNRRRGHRRSERDLEGEEGDGGGAIEGSSSEAQGLLLWRRSTRKADSVAELKRCAMQFEAAIAWDKSIMKVLCQICRRDKNEARLLLCDGCDHGYHTYCFRPPMISIPEGDWFCYDCVSKATGKCHCFVCGLAKPLGVPDSASTTAVEPAHRLAQCAFCARGAHPGCLRPPLNRLPKRWTCMLCVSSGASGTSEKASISAGSASETRTPKKTNATRLDRPKRAYIKSGAYRSCKRTKPKSELFKQNTAEHQRRVGRPKANSDTTNSGGCNRRKDFPLVKKRGRPPSFYRRGHIGVAGVNEADDGEEIGGGGGGGGGGEDDGTEYDDMEGAEGEGEEGGGVGEPKETEPSGEDDDDEDDTESVTAVNGIMSSKRSAAVRCHRKLRKSPLSLSKRDFCKHATEDLMKHELSWPFRKPVCCKTVPMYRKIIRRPMDLSTILKRLCADKWNYYTSVAEWREDVRQIFKNCRIFNEDDSEIGRAGHELRRYFETNWAHAPRLLSPEDTSTLMGTPNGEDSIATAPSSPECHEPSTCAPSPVAKPVSEVNDIPPFLLLPPPPPSSEDVEASTTPKSVDLPTEDKGVLDSSCGMESVVDSIRS